MPPRRSTVRVHIHPLGDTALIAELGTRLDSALNTRAIALAAALAGVAIHENEPVRKLECHNRPWRLRSASSADLRVAHLQVRQVQLRMSAH